MHRSYNDQLQQIVKEYREEKLPWPVEAEVIARWGIETRRWEPERHSFLRLLTRDLGRAMRDEYYTDPQGRRVRAKHAARTRSGTKGFVNLWGDIQTSEPKFLERAFKQRRGQIVDDCIQLKTDVDSFNDNRLPEKPIKMIWDFTDDIAEREYVPKASTEGNRKAISSVSNETLQYDEKSRHRASRSISQLVPSRP